MNKNENAGGFLCTDEERLLISRATEISRREANSAVALSFLTPREQRLVFESAEKDGYSQRIFFWGGYRGAERRRAIFLPSWLESDSPCRAPLFSVEREDFFLSLLSSMGLLDICSELVLSMKMRGSGYLSLSHRDFLGALMALGIKRNVIGDICVDNNTAVVFCDEKAHAFVLDELKRAGRDTVTCSQFSAGVDFQPVRHFEDICASVASVRFDGVVRALCSISREDACELVHKGLCEINFFMEKEPDRIIREGDIVSVRGYGKYIIDRACDLTKRGRIRLVARKYV